VREAADQCDCECEKKDVAHETQNESMEQTLSFWEHVCVLKKSVTVVINFFVFSLLFVFFDSSDYNFNQ
jgi:hypothetical protein